MIDDRTVKVLLAIAETKSISKAAAQLYIAQPSISRLLKKVESDLGFPIFNRTRIPLQLTPKGKVYIEYLNQMLSIEADMHSKLCEIDELKHNELVVSSLSFFSISIYPLVIPEFIQCYPDIDLVISDYNPGNYEKSILYGEIDVFLSNSTPKNNQLSYRTIKEDELILVCNITERLQCLYDLRKNSVENPNVIDLSELRDETFYLLAEGTNVRDSVEHIFRSQSFSPKNRIIVPNMVAATSLVDGGKGATFIAKSSLRYLTLNKNLIYFIFPDSKKFLSVTAIYKKGRKDPLIHKFCDIVEKNIK